MILKRITIASKNVIKVDYNFEIRCVTAFGSVSRKCLELSYIAENNILFYHLTLVSCIFNKKSYFSIILFFNPNQIS